MSMKNPAIYSGIFHTHWTVKFFHFDLKDASSTLFLPDSQLLSTWQYIFYKRDCLPSSSDLEWYPIRPIHVSNLFLKKH